MRLQGRKAADSGLTLVLPRFSSGAPASRLPSRHPTHKCFSFLKITPRSHDLPQKKRESALESPHPFGQGILKCYRGILDKHETWCAPLDPSLGFALAPAFGMSFPYPPGRRPVFQSPSEGIIAAGLD